MIVWQLCVAKGIFSNDDKLHKNYKNCIWSLIFTLSFHPTGRIRILTLTIHISRTSLVRCLRKFLSRLPVQESCLENLWAMGHGPMSICVCVTIITAVRIWLKSFTTSNSKQLLTLCFIHDALIGGWSSFDVKLLWDWIVSTYCWKIKAILWYELVLLHSQDQIPLDWKMKEARKSASGI